MEVTKFRKVTKILLMGSLFIIFLASMTYVYIRDPFGFRTMKLDKYKDILSWCNSNVTNEGLLIDCKALLLDISSGEDNESCFVAKVIAENQKLNTITICESGSTLAYTNEILSYKMLMPIDISFLYTKENVLNNYSLNNISITALNEGFVQNIINESIANLVTLDPSSTTIENSVDFCPSPDTLPDYVTDENKEKYAIFYSNNTMKKEKYFDKYLYGWDDSTIRILFACDSAEKMGYTDVCNKTKMQGLNLLVSDVPALTAVPSWDESVVNSEESSALLKEISLIYDSMFLKEQKNNLTNVALLKELISKINDINNISVNVFCSLNNIYTSLSKYEPSFQNDIDYIAESLSSQENQIPTPICSSLLRPSYIDKNGLVIFYIVKLEGITQACFNLSLITQ